MISWIGADGNPSSHLIRAATHVVLIVDRDGSHSNDLQQSYSRRATGGLFALADLLCAEALLLDCGLLTRRNDYIHPSTILTDAASGDTQALISLICLKAIDRLASIQSSTIEKAVRSFGNEMESLIEDAQRREEILLAFARRFDDASRLMCGEIGEEVVMRALRSDLNEMGYAHLARAVRRVSLESDQLGYDISAPRLLGAPRMIEVKATTVEVNDTVVVYVTRNEADAGLRFHDWSLVVCCVTSMAEREGYIVGWCSARDISRHLPIDSTVGIWREAQITLAVSLLRPGLPPATA